MAVTIKPAQPDHEKRRLARLQRAKTRKAWRADPANRERLDEYNKRRRQKHAENRLGRERVAAGVQQPHTDAYRTYSVMLTNALAIEIRQIAAMKAWSFSATCARLLYLSLDVNARDRVNRRLNKGR